MGYLFYKRIIKVGGATYLVSYLRKCCKYLILTVLAYSVYHCLKLSFSPDSNTLLKDFFKELVDWKNLYYGIDSAGMFHLWFLFVPFYILPLVYALRKRISILTFVFFIFNVIGILMQGMAIDIQVRDALFYGGFYICLGGVVCLYEVKIQEWICKIKMSSLLVSLLFFNVLQISESLLWGGRLLCGLSTIFITLILFSITLKNNDLWKNSKVNKVGLASLGIYLVHPLIIDFLYLVMYKVSVDVSHTILWQICLTPFVFVISYGVYKFLLKFSRVFDATTTIKQI